MKRSEILEKLAKDRKAISFALDKTEDALSNEKSLDKCYYVINSLVCLLESTADRYKAI
ncbi:hypothetical protein KAS41_02385 [Candidatus Parcubacteria bacterium]|nr:hypothetical protein [Candidatus Parcubacteria bacterium]